MTQEQVPEQPDPVSKSAMLWTGVEPDELLRSLLFCIVNRSRIRFPFVLSCLIVSLISPLKQLLSRFKLMLKKWLSNSMLNFLSCNSHSFCVCSPEISFTYLLLKDFKNVWVIINSISLISPWFFIIEITVVENSQAAVTNLGKEINLAFLHSPCVF